MVSPTMPTYARADIALQRGEEAYLFDEEGRRYLDFASGIAVTGLGHNHPRLTAALHDAVDKVWHTSNLFRIPMQETLAERLVEKSFADTVFFTNSGTEAIECLIKVVRKYHNAAGQFDRYRIITFEGAFHGRTLAALAAGGQSKHLAGFGPVVDGFDQVPFGDVAAAGAAITKESAAFLVEPIQGEGGIRCVPEGFLQELRDLASSNSMLLCFDEVQCGMGRTGHLFAHELWGVKPDILAVAKGLGGGFPVGACLATAEAARGMTAGTHGSTFGGNPLAMAVGGAVLDTLFGDGLLKMITPISKKLRHRLEDLIVKHRKKVAEIRGHGLMIGIKFYQPPNSLIDVLRNNGLLAVIAAENVIRLLPPLIINEAHIEEAFSILDSTIGRWEG